jgi:hypothetical protein
MGHFRKFEREINTINDFKQVYQEYLELSLKHYLTPEEIARKQQCREKVNSLSGEVLTYVGEAGVATFMYYSPPPAIGGMAGEVGLIENIFNLRRFNIPSQHIFDMLEKAIGNYRYFQKEHRKKIINPFYWLGSLIKIPFGIITFAGFDGAKLEMSLIGKLYKLIAALILLISAIVKILEYCGINFSDLKNGFFKLY